MKINRRKFMGTLSVIPFSMIPMMKASANDETRITSPRATSGDDRFEPDWDQELIITVGQDKNADIQGMNDKAIQAAVDYAGRLKRGTVKILAGQYQLNSSIHIPSGIRLIGSGEDTVLKKNEMVSSPLEEDSDWYDQEITIKNPEGFNLGDSVFITGRSENGSFHEAKRILVARNGNRFKLNKGLRKNFWLKENATVSNLFPLLTSEFTSGVTIENLVLDGNRENNGNMNGNYGGCVFIQDCKQYTFRNLTTRNYNGDGISWQICHDVVVTNCHTHDNADLGYHPGSGSQRPLIRDNRIENNGIGIFFCWGVKYGLAEDNVIKGTKKHGVSIGHNDTDNIVRNNEIADSGINGVLFRDDPRGKDFWPNRNLIENNKVINTGDEQGIAIDVQGKTREVILKNNSLIEKRGPMSRTGIRISKEAADIKLTDNRFEGFSRNVVNMQES